MSSSSRPQRYCVWIGARRAPITAVGEIRAALEEFQPWEFHSRDWENGGFIVPWLCLATVYFFVRVHVCLYFKLVYFIFPFLTWFPESFLRVS